MKEYDAFISYSHADAAAAVGVQRFLESYPLPREGCERRRKLRVYLDHTDIRSGALTGELRGALTSSRALIVCASPAAAASRWVADEIEFFRKQEPARSLSVVLVAGEVSDALPASLRGEEQRISDLRGGRGLGFWLPRARLELIRVIALIAGVELRVLIPWDRRRRRQRWAVAGAAALVIGAAILAFPVEAWDPLPAPFELRTGAQVVAGEVRDGQLTVATRFRGEGPQGSRDYVDLRTVGEKPSKPIWMENNHNPRSRLLPRDVADRNMIGRAMTALRPTALDQRTKLWVGEPCPSCFVAVQRIEPADDERPQDATDPPVVGKSIVYVYRDGGTTQRVEVPGLYPEALRYAGPRAFSPADGLAVAWTDAAIWIGVPGRKDDNGHGGLWRSADHGRSWHRAEGFASVYSLLPTRDGSDAMLVTEIGRPLRFGVTLQDYPSRMTLRTRDGRREDFPGPPYGQSSEIELCGYLADGRLTVRVDQRIFVRGRRPVLSRWISWGHSEVPSRE